MEAIALDETTTAKQFNANLKRFFKEELKLDCRVRIINSYKFPRCYTEVWVKTDNQIPNDLRKLAAKTDYPDMDFSTNDNVSLGNIRPQMVCIYAEQWENVLQQYLSNK